MSVTRERLRAVLSEPTALDRRKPGKHAATAAVLTPTWALLLMRRAEYEGDPWSGHLSFPGGRVEPADADPLAAAIRETDEEFGLNLAVHGTLLGALSPLETYSGGLVIHPFVFALNAEPELSPNHEVAAVHRLGLNTLLTGVGRGRMVHPWRGVDVTMPCVDFSGGRLWGLTLAQVDDLLHRLDGGGRGLARPVPSQSSG